MAGVKPYKIISRNQPALVTVCTSDLAVDTWVAGSALRRHAGMIPVLVEPPLVALASLPEAEGSEIGKLVLLGADGRTICQVAEGELLLPAAGSLPLDCAYVAVGSGGDAITPFGAAPHLAKYDTTSGRQLWRIELKPALDTAGIELWAAEGAGVLTLQYGFNVYEFVMFDLNDGTISTRKMLQGQPGYRLVYPGPDAEQAGCQLRDGILSLLVLLDSALPEQWRFDLAACTISTQPWSGSLPDPAREDNASPAGGTGPPDPGAPPFPQGLLPTQTGDTWTIPALVDELGRVLVVHGDEADWIEINTP